VCVCVCVCVCVIATRWRKVNFALRALHCDSVCCSVLQILQGVAGCCRVVVQEAHRTAAQCSTLKHCNALQCTAPHCNTLRHTRGLAKDAHRSDPISEYDHPYHLNITYSITNSKQTEWQRRRIAKIVQSTAIHCNAATHYNTTTHCNSRQRTAMHCNTPQGW